MMAAAARATQVGVTLYEHTEFNVDGLGWSGFFGTGMHSGDFPNDVVTSYKIDDGCCAIFYEHYGYEGQSFAECGPSSSIVPDEWNDVISSMKVECMTTNAKGEIDKVDYGQGELALDQAAKDLIAGKKMQAMDKAAKKYKDEYAHDKEILNWEQSELKQMKDPEWWEVAPGYVVYFFMYSFLYYPPT